MNKHVFEKIAKLEKTELSEVKVDLAVTDEVATKLKDINNVLKIANDSNNKVVKLVEQVNTAYKKAAPFVNYSKTMGKQIDGLYKNLEKLAKELGVNVQSTEAFKGIQDSYQFLGQIEDAMVNMKNAISSIGK
jgi:uncharacterized coiled-coil DUF342 family protein